MTQAGPDAPAVQAVPRSIAGTVAAWVRLFRPHQWTKNAFVLVPLLFSGRISEASALASAIEAFLVFCALASSVYAINDARDAAADRAHPTKRTRPVASGAIRHAHAVIAGAAIAATALAVAWAIRPVFGIVALGYLSLNLAYTIRLKHVVILDVFCIAAFFLLRLIGGATAIDVRASVWLLVCGGLLALYLGFSKRRHELLLLEAGSGAHRSVLTDYSAEFLDQMSSVLLSVTIVAYLMYTLTSDTAALVGGEALSYSTVFVLYGVFRYSYLVHKRRAGNPTETLLTDPVLLTVVGLWLLYCGVVIYHPF